MKSRVGFKGIIIQSHRPSARLSEIAFGTFGLLFYIETHNKGLGYYGFIKLTKCRK